MRSAREWEHKFGRNLHNWGVGGTDNSEVWKKLWKLSVPGKVKNFGRRGPLGQIPCRAVLANRHIGNIGGCPMCESAAEDIKHLLFTYEIAFRFGYLESN